MKKSILPALAKDWVFIASDGGYDFLPGSAPSAGHPRDTGKSASEANELVRSSEG